MIKKDLLKYTGNINQYAGITTFIYNDGKGKGIEAYRVKTGTTLDFTVLKDRSFDIFEASYKGINLMYMTRNGLVNPYYYYPVEDGFGATMTGGLLFTCGLKNVGGGVRDINGYYHFTHGRNHVMPSVNSYAKALWEGDNYKFELGGYVPDTLFGGSSLVLFRNIISAMDSKEIVINDSVENQNSCEEEFMLLYHFNFGYPFIDEDAEIIINSPAKVKPFDDFSKEQLKNRLKFAPPNDHFPDCNYLHDIESDENGFVTVKIENKKHGFGVYIKFKKDTLPYCNIWKSVATGRYTLSVQPSNCQLLNRVKERENGTLKKISSFDQVKHKVILGIYDLE
ncbi:MAG TPA: DUF4432 family protein [Clostridiaceae bacterium]|nr:DUF4432 family protein [Clostridiaceae bacterium]